MAVRSLNDRPIRARPAPRACDHRLRAPSRWPRRSLLLPPRGHSAGEAEKPSRALRRLHVGFPGQQGEGEERERSSAGLEAGELVALGRRLPAERLLESTCLRQVAHPEGQDVQRRGHLSDHLRLLSMFLSDLTRRPRLRLRASIHRSAQKYGILRTSALRSSRKVEASSKLRAAPATDN